LQTIKAQSEKIVCHLDDLIKELKEKHSFESKESYQTIYVAEYIDQNLSEPTDDLLEESDIIKLVKNQHFESENIKNTNKKFTVNFALNHLDKLFLFYDNNIL
jgi:hypothetical protein